MTDWLPEWFWPEPDQPRIPDGTPGIRDVDSPCAEFAIEGAPRDASCMTDGHYLCQECIHAIPQDPEDTLF